MINFNPIFAIHALVLNYSHAATYIYEFSGELLEDSSEITAGSSYELRVVFFDNGGPRLPVLDPFGRRIPFGSVSQTGLMSIGAHDFELQLYTPWPNPISPGFGTSTGLLFADDFEEEDGMHDFFQLSAVWGEGRIIRINLNPQGTSVFEGGRMPILNGNPSFSAHIWNKDDPDFISFLSVDQISTEVIPEPSVLMLGSVFAFFAVSFRVRSRSSRPLRKPSDDRSTSLFSFG